MQLSYASQFRILVVSNSILISLLPKNTKIHRHFRKVLPNEIIAMGLLKNRIMTEDEHNKVFHFKIC